MKLGKHQRTLMQIQRDTVISSESEGKNTDSDAYQTLRKEGEPLESVGGLAQINLQLAELKRRPLTPLDKRLVKGFYIKNMKELDRDPRIDLCQKNTCEFRSRV